MDRDAYKTFQGLGTFITVIGFFALCFFLMILSTGFSFAVEFLLEYPLYTALMLAGPVLKYGLWRFCRPQLNNTFKKISVTAPAFDCSSDGSFWEKAVGTSNYDEELHNLGTGLHTAHIVREQGNPYDENACMVTIEGHIVGYLSRTEAKRAVNWARKKQNISGDFIIRCPAKIIGGGKNEQGEKMNYGVRLDYKLK